MNGLGTRLVLPLLLLAGAAFAVNQWWDAQGFFVNVATELLGIVVTVAYVDWVLKRHEQQRWGGAD